MTAEFPYYTPPFARFNVAQKAALPYLATDSNLVVSFETAAGKTVLAECCFGFHLSTGSQSKVAYVCPFRSLASEKHRSWSANTQFSTHGVVLGTSETDTTLRDYENARIAVLTLEAFDAKTRSRAYSKWLGCLSCVVYDEAHLLGDGQRGCALESSAMRLSRVNPAARIILLSATMENAVELAKWVKSLNGKPTKCIVNRWRPTRIEIEYRAVKAGEKVSAAVEEAMRFPAKKTIVFVHSKDVGKGITKSLRRSGVRTAFHNASLTAKQRKSAEKCFDDRMSGLNVLVSTSTLGAGVNIA